MRRIFLIALLLPGLWGCKNETESKLFRIHDGNNLGIDFRNTITTSDTFNALNFEYIYNGSGVGVGDFDNDGREDLFFGGNQVSSELYLNKGDKRFRKVTAAALVTTSRWVTGVSVIDINRDGWLDIYLCVGGPTAGKQRENLLFINQGIRDGIPVFREMAASYGLNDDSYSTMAAFFDYDKDGDPDMYLVNNWLEKFNRNNIRPRRVNGEAESTDKLYRNNGDGTFTDVSTEAGILIEGYGLGVNIADINNDSWPDVYVSNDFLSNDLLWINQGDGTFKNTIADFLKHQTHNGMGVDIADFNNDELADIVVVDMLPPGHYRQKMMTAGQNYDHFHMATAGGYEPQYMRNTLQLNRGQTEDGRVLFSEIAFLSGVAQTDWSWAPLFADFDNDGWKDLFIANGYRKDVTNVDFIFYGLMNEKQFGKQQQTIPEEQFNQLEEVKISNYIFGNTGTLEFKDKTREWGLDHPSFSNGAVYMDIDRDGDLDLVTNNIDQEVLVYENTSKQHASFLQLQCRDTSVFNQKIWVFANGHVQFQEYSPYRGFQSTVTGDMHFGLGTATGADSVRIVWPDNRMAIYRSVPSGRLEFKKEDAIYNYQKKSKQHAFEFESAGPSPYKHREQSPSDIRVTRTLLQEITRNGPSIAVGDVNGDGLDDFFAGSEPGIPSTLHIQQGDGSFRAVTFDDRPAREDGAAVFFDVDSDGDPDLYVASASMNITEMPGLHALYLNDGHGSFTSAEHLPEITVPSTCLAPFDFDGDGDTDLFVGSRFKPLAYPNTPESYLLRNDGGKFTDVTVSNAELMHPGMVTAALWADVDHDSRADLIVAGDWMPIRVFLNKASGFREQTASFGLDETHGWWNCLRAADVNGDGFVDIIAGNNGKNSFLKPTSEKPVTMIAKDFDRNGSIDPVVTYFNEIENDRFILHNRLVLIDQIPGIKKRFETFTEYAKTNFAAAFTDEEREDALVLEAFMPASVVLLNINGKRFEIQELPEVTQLSTLNDVLVDDLNHDGNPDLIAIGNTYHQETLYGNYDASIGTVLLGDGHANWTHVRTTGFIADGDARLIRRINLSSGRESIMIGNNNGDLLLLRKSDNSTNLLTAAKSSR